MLMPIYTGNADSWKSVWLRIVFGLILMSIFYDKLLDSSTSNSLAAPKRRYYVPKNVKLSPIPEFNHLKNYGDKIITQKTESTERKTTIQLTPITTKPTITTTSKTTSKTTQNPTQKPTQPIYTNNPKSKVVYTPRADIKLPSIVPGNLASTDKLLCPLDRRELNLDNITPRKHLHHDRYLLNLSPFGPNNQIRGFRDTIVLAIYLNRTIIMPPWYRHEFDPALKRIQGKRDRDLNYRDFSDLMDVEELAKYVTVLPFSALKDVCPDGMDAAFFARDPVAYHTWNQMQSYEHLSNVSITRNLTERSKIKKFSCKTELKSLKSVKKHEYLERILRTTNSKKVLEK